MILDKLPKPFLVLAPMDDVADTVFRQIIAEISKPDLFITEFVNVDGLQSPGRTKLLHKLWFSAQEKPIFAQLWGLKPENFYKTASEVKKMGFDGVDLNMGCPVKKVVKSGACGGLINNPTLAGEIIEAARAGAGNDFPVSVKTRVGFTTFDQSWLESLLNKKLDLLTIHTRTVAQMSKTPADWPLMESVRTMRDYLSPLTKLVGNGDVKSRVQAEKIAKQYVLDGVMIGRGILHDPFAFAHSSPWSSWDKNRKLRLFEKHIRLHEQTYKKAQRKFENLRKFCRVYINGFDGAAELRSEFMRTHSSEEALKLLARYQGSSQASLNE